MIFLHSKKRVTEKRATGDFGERAAARWLWLRGYRILERNWFSYRRELDIVARRRGVLVFCEVKTRAQSPENPSPYGPPSAAVNAQKRRNLLSAARAYLHFSGWEGDCRMDIIEVYIEPAKKEGKKPKILKIRQIQNAFTA